MSATDIALITNLLGRYTHIVDTEPIAGVAQLFWDDATLISPDGQRHTGIDAIVAWFERWDTTMRAPVTELRHRITSPHIDVTGSTARARCYVDADALTRNHLIAIRGRYIDELERRHDEWRFTQRHIEAWTPPARTPLPASAPSTSPTVRSAQG